MTHLPIAIPDLKMRERERARVWFFFLRSLFNRILGRQKLKGSIRKRKREREKEREREKRSKDGREGKAPPMIGITVAHAFGYPLD